MTRVVVYAVVLYNLVVIGCLAISLKIFSMKIPIRTIHAYKQSLAKVLLCVVEYEKKKQIYFVYAHIHTRINVNKKKRARFMRLINQLQNKHPAIAREMIIL